MMLKRPPIRSVCAGALPLYGTCTMSKPASWFISWPARCDIEPDDGAAAGPAVDDDRLSPHRLQPIGEHAREHVGRAARREGHDELHRALWKRGGLLGTCRRRDRQQASEHEQVAAQHGGVL